MGDNKIIISYLWIEYYTSRFVQAVTSSVRKYEKTHLVLFNRRIYVDINIQALEMYRFFNEVFEF